MLAVRSLSRRFGMEEFFQKMKQNSVVILLLLTGAVFLFLKYLSPLLSPILTAMLFVTIFGPLLKKMQKLHLHRQVGAVLLLVLALAIFAGILWVLCRWIWKDFPQLLAMVEGWKTMLPQWADQWVDTILMRLKAGELSMEKGILGGAFKYAGRAAALGGYLVTFLIAVILLAKDYDELMNRLLDREDCHLLLEVICGVIRYIATYVKAQGVIMSVIAALCALVLAIAGIPRGPLWGILAGVLDALPFIGTGVVLVPLTIAQMFEGRIWAGVICLLLYVTCIIVREIMEPRLIGKRIGVRPILVLISLYVGIRLFGVAGIIKGPLGFIIIWETWQHRKENAKEDRA